MHDRARRQSGRRTINVRTPIIKQSVEKREIVVPIGDEVFPHVWIVRNAFRNAFGTDTSYDREKSMRC